MNQPTSFRNQIVTGLTPTAASRSRLLDRRRAIEISSVVCLLVCAIVLARLFPVEQGIERLREWVAGRGLIGVIAFGAAYVIAGLLFLPGAALTLAAGAVFGSALGVLVVSIASTMTSTIAFVIARHLARGKVERWASTSPRFASIDRAIGAEGWKIIALLRLSPAMPYSLSNYLYGLTSIRFVPYVVTSWIFMLPGTTLYVFTGHVGATGLAGADSAGGGVTFAWIVIGLLATLVVTIFVSRIAKRALAARHTIDTPAPPSASDEQLTRPALTGNKSGTLTRTSILGILALLALTLTSVACAMRDSIRSAFGPPRVHMTEAHSSVVGGTTFDHSAFDVLLREFVHGGTVDYVALQARSADLDLYIADLGRADFQALSRDEKLALLLNAYNACTLRLILDHYPVASIRDIPSEDRWSAVRWEVAGALRSLDQIENDMIRPNFKDARIHFALVCAAVGCPPLRSEAYDAKKLDAQLDDQCRLTHSDPRWFRFKPGDPEAHLTRLYEWYADDFRQHSGTTLLFAAKYAPDLKQALASGSAPRIAYLSYDWALNSSEASR